MALTAPSATDLTSRSTSSMPGPKPVFKNVPMSGRVPRNVRQMVEALVPVWRAQAEERGDDFEEIDLSHTFGELLATAAIAEWAHWGVKELPTSEDGWDELVARTVERIRKEARAAKSSK
jgi:hypothetical protein